LAERNGPGRGARSARHGIAHAPVGATEPAKVAGIRGR
jgi:hypothetical protein